MKLQQFPILMLTLTLILAFFTSAVSRANPRTGAPTNLHRQFVVEQTKRKAAQGKPVRKNVGVWLSGGFEKTVADARKSGYRPRRSRRFRRW